MASERSAKLIYKKLHGAVVHGFKGICSHNLEGASSFFRFRAPEAPQTKLFTLRTSRGGRDRESFREGSLENFSFEGFSDAQDAPGDPEPWKKRND